MRMALLSAASSDGVMTTVPDRRCVSGLSATETVSLSPAAATVIHSPDVSSGAAVHVSVSEEEVTVTSCGAAPSPSKVSEDGFTEMDISGGLALACCVTVTPRAGSLLPSVTCILICPVRCSPLLLSATDTVSTFPSCETVIHACAAADTEYSHVTFWAWTVTFWTVPPAASNSSEVGETSSDFVSVSVLLHDAARRATAAASNIFFVFIVFCF